MWSLASCAAGMVATVSISGDAVAIGNLQLSASSYSTAQSAGSVTVSVNRTGGSSGAIGVSYATANGTTSSNTFCSGTGYGYVGQSGTLTFQPGVTSQTIRVPLLNCGVSLASGFQEFTLNLSNNSSDSTIARAQTTITETP